MSDRLLDGLPFSGALHSKEDAVTVLRGIADRVESGRYVLQSASVGLGFSLFTEIVELEFFDTEAEVHKRSSSRADGVTDGR